MSKERGIIFNAEMVRAVLDDRKTQTRRILSPRQIKMIDIASSIGECYPLESGNEHDNSQSYYREWCPFGKVGDRLWVRETWQAIHDSVDEHGNVDERTWMPSILKAPDSYWHPVYAASGDNEDLETRGFPWRPSLHMPRWASRITLEITGVRVERLNSISEADAAAEGVGSAVWFAAKGVTEEEWTSLGEHGGYRASHINSFATLWESIYGQESWRANPWVWVIEFKKVESSNG